MNSHRRIWIGLACVLCLRLIYVLTIPNRIEIWRDGLSYDNIARNLTSGLGYWDTTGDWPNEPPFADPSAPTARWLPGYPMFIAGIYTVFGQSYRAVYLAQAALGVVIAVLAYSIARLLIGERAGIVSIFLYAVDPFAVYLCGHFQTEQLFTVFILASLYLFLKAREESMRRSGFAFLFALSMGAATLTRSIAGVMFAGLCMTILFGWDQGFRSARIGTRALILAIASTVFIGILSPWLIRNYRVTGHYVLTTEAWQALAMTNNDRGGAYEDSESLGGMPQVATGMPEIAREAIYKKYVVDWIATHQARFARFYLWRIAAFWWPSAKTVSGFRALVGFVFSSVVYLLGALYVIAFRRHWRGLLPIYATLITFTLGYSTALVTTRYRLPLYPLLEILAAGGAIHASQFVGAKLLR